MKRIFLPLVAFLEGFTTLAFQMVALRKAIPYVGSSIILTSIVIGIILLALSGGYFMGGVLTSRLDTNRLMKRLQLYLIISAFYYLLIVYPSFSRILQHLLSGVGFTPTLFLFSLLFFAVPTFLASHTMPIITHVSQGTKGYAAGKILFISTLGSFLGSTLTTLVLFPYMGVYMTGIVASMILLLCSFLVYMKRIYIISIVVVCLGTFSSFFIPNNGYSYEDTPYQTIRILEGSFHTKNVRVMELNGGWASGIQSDTKKSFFPYVRYMYDTIAEKKFAKIAVIGAAGCTLPQEVAKLSSVKQVDVIDIDKRVFPIAEQSFLQERLNTKIHPIVQSARGWIYDMQKNHEQYDIIIVDVYNGTSMPEELMTQEFFQGLSTISPTIMLNVIIDKTLTSPFAQGFIATLQSVFGDVYMYDASSTKKDISLGNIVFTTFANTNSLLLASSYHSIYTDDKNEADSLRVQMMY